MVGRDSFGANVGLLVVTPDTPGAVRFPVDVVVVAVGAPAYLITELVVLDVVGLAFAVEVDKREGLEFRPRLNIGCEDDCTYCCYSYGGLLSTNYC